MLFYHLNDTILVGALGAVASLDKYMRMLDKEKRRKVDSVQLSSLLYY